MVLKVNWFLLYLNLVVHHHWINPWKILWGIHLSFHFRMCIYLLFFWCCHIVWCTCVSHTFASFSVSLDFVWQPGSLINMDSVSWKKVQLARKAQINLTACYSWQHNIGLSAFFKILLLAKGLSGLFILLFCTIVLGWIVEIPFENSRADLKISEFTHS